MRGIRTTDHVRGVIEDVNTAAYPFPLAVVRDPVGKGLLHVDLSYAPGPDVMLPKVGDVWWVHRRHNRWALDFRESKAEALAATLHSPPRDLLFFQRQAQDASVLLNDSDWTPFAVDNNDDLLSFHLDGPSMLVVNAFFQFKAEDTTADPTDFIGHVAVWDADNSNMVVNADPTAVTVIGTTIWVDAWVELVVFGHIAVTPDPGGGDFTFHWEAMTSSSTPLHFTFGDRKAIIQVQDL